MLCIPVFCTNLKMSLQKKEHKCKQNSKIFLFSFFKNKTIKCLRENGNDFFNDIFHGKIKSLSDSSHPQFFTQYTISLTENTIQQSKCIHTESYSIKGLQAVWFKTDVATGL